MGVMPTATTIPNRAVGARRLQAGRLQSAVIFTITSFPLICVVDELPAGHGFRARQKSVPNFGGNAGEVWLTTVSYGYSKLVKYRSWINRIRVVVAYALDPGHCAQCNRSQFPLGCLQSPLLKLVIRTRPQ